jgi:hypothetical protein
VVVGQKFGTVELEKVEHLFPQTTPSPSFDSGGASMARGVEADFTDTA